MKRLVQIIQRLYFQMVKQSQEQIVIVSLYLLHVNTTATGSAAIGAAGTFYINGFFVKADAETLILDKYTNTPSYRVGYSVTESFVTPNDDSSLNDNATGSSNANAPGAHRFKIQLTLL